MAENYMIDYLENVCAHRYAKLYRKERKSDKRTGNGRNIQPEALRKKWSAAVEEVQEEPVSEQEQVYAMEHEEPAKRRKDGGRKRLAGSAGAPDFRRIFGIVLI